MIFSIAIAALGIGFLILAHEFGHFITAKMNKVTVLNFSIGFGPEIFGFTRGQTRYSLRWVPLGGYVKMLGDEPGSDESLNEHSFLAQKYWRKCLIIIAGSATNILLALVLFIAVFKIGVALPSAKIGMVVYGSPAYYAGIEMGDVIIRLDGRGNVDFNDLFVRGRLAAPGERILMTLERDGREIEIPVYAMPSEQGYSMIGVAPYPTLEIGGFVSPLERSPNSSAKEPSPENDSPVVIESPSHKAGLEAGDIITAFNGKTVESWHKLEELLSFNGLSPFSITVARGGEEKTFEIQPIRSPRPFVGVVFFSGQIETVAEDSLAAEMGLAAGDRIVAVGQQETGDVWEVRYWLARHSGETPTITVERGSERIELSWPGKPRRITELFAGLEFAGSTRVAHVVPASNAEKMGIAVGDLINQVDGQDVHSVKDIHRLLEGSTGDVIQMGWLRDGREMQASFVPALVDIYTLAEKRMVKLALADACRVGFAKAWDFGSQVYTIISRALRGQEGMAKTIGGPITIARMSYATARYASPTQFLLFLAIISINLGIVNLVPIPILDGGLLAIFTVEKVKGSPLPLKVMAAIQYAGLAIILALFLFVTYQDILRIFQ